MHSSSAFLLKVVIERQHCRREQFLIAICIVLALAGTGFSGLLSPAGPGLPIVLPVTLAGVLAALNEIRRASPANARSAACVGMLPGGELLVGREPATLRPARLTGRWILPRHVVGIGYVDADGVAGRLLLFRADTSADSWRRLVVHLRFT